MDNSAKKSPNLKRHGLKTVCRNYRCRSGEIDLVMRDREFIVFVEVRYRRSNDYGDPLESITPGKQKRIIRAARHFLCAQPEWHDAPCRFDAVGVSSSDGRTDFNWIKDAFST